MSKPPFLVDVEQRISRHPIAQKMSYPQRIEAKVEVLQRYFPAAEPELQGLFEAVLYNTSLKPNHIEGALKFLKPLKEQDRASAQALIVWLFAPLSPAAQEVGLSEHKQARQDQMQQVLEQLDLIRRFVKSTPPAARSPGSLSRLASALAISPAQAMEMVSIRPRILRGLVKPPRPFYACLVPLALSFPLMAATVSAFPSLSSAWLTTLVVLFVGGLTALISTKAMLAPGVVRYELTRKRLQQCLNGQWHNTEVVPILEQLGVKAQEYLRSRRYEFPDIRVEIRDKRTLEGALQFLTSSEEIGNCIALRNFVSWTLPALLNDESVMLADISYKGSNLWQQRAQLWMVAARRAGKPVLTVNSLEFNNEGAKYLEPIMPRAVEVLQDVARTCGFEEIYVGISDFGRNWFDRHFPQALEGGPVEKIHPSELGFTYYFDAYRRQGKGWQFMRRRSLGACAYALLFGLLEALQGNHAKARAFWDSARNRHNCWSVPLGNPKPADVHP